MTSMTFLCHVCGLSFSTMSNLLKHITKKHPLKHYRPKKEISKHKCPTCTHGFTRNTSLKRHMETIHNIVMVKSASSNGKTYNCNDCSKCFTVKSSLFRHIHGKHGSLVTSVKADFICPVTKCQNQKFVSRKNLLKHLLFSHDIIIENEKRTFSSEEEFQSWFELEKTQHNLRFVTKRRENNKVTLICNRSGIWKPQGTGKRLVFKPSIKTGKYCPARILVTRKQGKVFVNYFKTHIGHSSGKKAIGFSQCLKVNADCILDMEALQESSCNEVEEVPSTNGSTQEWQVKQAESLWNILKGHMPLLEHTIRTNIVETLNRLVKSIEAGLRKGEEEHTKIKDKEKHIYPTVHKSTHFSSEHNYCEFST